MINGELLSFNYRQIIEIEANPNVGKNAETFHQ
jgi:hypothetical protein